MAAPVPQLAFNTDFAPETGRPEPVAPAVARLTAPNAGPYTFRGTNSFLIGDDPLFVVDPGPDDAAHLQALLAAIGRRRVEAILLTHTHKDHSLLAGKLKAATGAPLWFGGRHRLSRAARPLEPNPVDTDSDWHLVPDRQLRHGESIAAGEVALEVIATPGHCANHLGFGLAGTDWLLTGDHIMGWNSTLVAVPDGSMADYLASLQRVVDLPYRHYLPAHGGAIDDGPSYARALLAHREHRNAQVVAAVAAGAKGISALLKAIYPGLLLPVQLAARMTLAAHVEYLADRGLIRARHTPFGLSLRPA